VFKDLFAKKEPVVFEYRKLKFFIEFVVKGVEVEGHGRFKDGLEK
jgi:hypothetical protein